MEKIYCIDEEDTSVDLGHDDTMIIVTACDDSEISHR